MCPTLCNPMNCSMPGPPVHHQLPEFIQSHVHWVGDVIQPSHPLSSPSPPALNLSQHQGLFKWVSSSHQVAKVLEFQLQNQSLVSRKQQGDSVIHIYLFLKIYIYFLTCRKNLKVFFPCRFLQNIEYSDLWYTVGPCWLPILYIVVYIC